MPYPDQATAIQGMTEDAWKIINASQQEYIDALVKRYSEFEARISADILKLHTETFEDGTADYSTFVQAQGDIKLAEIIKNELRRLNQDVNESLLDELISQYKDAYNTSAWVIDQSTPPSIEINYDMPTESTLRQLVSSDWKGAMFSQRIGIINDFMAKDIQQEVIQSVLSGDSAKTLSKRISDVIGTEDSDYKYRASMIARTELMRASNLAGMAALEQNDDIMETWVWISRSLASPRLCEYCAERSGMTYEEVQALIEEDDEQAEKGLDPPAHPHCACIWGPKVKSWAELLGGDVTERIKPTAMVVPRPDGEGYDPAPKMGYNEWADKILSDADRGSL